MTRILVTGGAGFIGSAVVRELLSESGNLVCTCDALTYAGHLETLADVLPHPRHHFARADIRDAAALRQLFGEVQPDAVIHLAAETHVDRSIDGPLEFVHTNVVGTANMLTEALRYWKDLDSVHANAFRFLHVSTDEVFGTLGGHGAFDEQSPYDPRSPYAASKASSDHLARACWHTYGLPVVIANCSNNYGPFQYPEKLIPLVTLAALAEQPVPLYGDGKHVRDWIHVSDHARGLVAALRRATPGSTCLFSAENERTNIEVATRICDALDLLTPPTRARARRELITFVPDRPGHDRRYALSAARTRKALEWAPRIAFDDGIHATVQWYCEHLAWCDAVRRGNYQGERLGLSSPVSHS